MDINNLVVQSDYKGKFFLEYKQSNWLWQMDNSLTMTYSYY